MHVEVHFVAETELFHELSKLLERVEKAYTSPTIKVIRLD